MRVSRRTIGILATVYAIVKAPVAQLDGAPPSAGGGRTFESLRVRHSQRLRHRRTRRTSC